MSTFNFSRYLLFAMVSCISIFYTGCEKYSDDLSGLIRPKNGDVFLDGFTPGMNYAAFGGSVVTAFQADKEVTYNQSAASMRIDVPIVNDPRGSYAGGTYFLASGRDLSGFNVLTFWAKATKSAKINEVGFGNDLGANTYATAIYNVPVTTVWQKYYIPIPDPSKLTNERGMFYFAEGHEDSAGYSFWIDEVKFEKLGTIVRGESMILDGANFANNSVIGVETALTGLYTNFSLPDGTNLKMPTPPSYFTFESSNPTIASVNLKGKINSLNIGYSVITAVLDGKNAKGSLVLNVGNFVQPPTPTIPSTDVKSLFSENYVSASQIDFPIYGGSTVKIGDFTVAGNKILTIASNNYMGIEFKTNPIDGSTMGFLHLDVLAQDGSSSFEVQIRDIGANRLLETDVNTGNPAGDDKDYRFTISGLIPEKWKSVTIPLAGNIASQKSNLGALILVGGPNFYLDNIYFHK